MQKKLFKTSDGAELSYISAGQGKPIVMLHGWSQSAEQFKYQIPAFAEHYRVIAEAIGDSLHSPRSGFPPSRFCWVGIHKLAKGVKGQHHSSP